MRVIRIIVFLLMLLAGAVIAKGAELRPPMPPPGWVIMQRGYSGYTIEQAWDWVYRDHWCRYGRYHSYPVWDYQYWDYYRRVPRWKVRRYRRWYRR